MRRRLRGSMSSCNQLLTRSELRPFQMTMIAVRSIREDVFVPTKRYYRPSCMVKLIDLPWNKISKVLRFVRRQDDVTQVNNKYFLKLVMVENYGQDRISLF